MNLARPLLTVEREGDARKITLSDGKQLIADQVLLAAGRKANTDLLGLEAAGVATEWDGRVAVNEYSQTNVPSIHAVGDVTDRVI